MHLIEVFLLFYLSIEDFHDLRVSVKPLMAFIIVHCLNSSFSPAGLIYVMLYAVFTLMDKCGLADLLFIMALCYSSTIMQISFIQITACLFSLTYMTINKQKQMPFIAALSFAYLWVNGLPLFFAGNIH